MRTEPIVTVEENDAMEFMHECENLFGQEYNLMTVSCGIVSSKAGGTTPIYQAIFIDPGVI